MKVFGFAGWSGSGKTTLIEQLLPQLVAYGLRVSLIKHTHHDFDLDQPGKDSWRHRQAGASEVLLSGGQRWALLHELREFPPPTLQELVSKLSPCDLVLVEGFKLEPIPKLEIHRVSLGKPLLHPNDPNIVAVATDSRITISLPLFDLNQAETIAAFIYSQVQP
ncbi:molybdopterin-guanine dinucleotide biosynthesis protein B [Chitinivorax sp. B]|uniref:molybdopterin-guanine dinucleotide biosynthesis protein B n=1 Tax=Chitinivorax sp. B TaxID=2502235 RepID=UPI0010F9E104|nr:molybdopterin-guanine dinucleotide biosynthesis protein B [Chitinivorax sp. B]